MKTTREKYRDSHILNITTIPKPHPTHPIPPPPPPPPPSPKTYHIPTLKRLKATPHTITRTPRNNPITRTPPPPPNPTQTLPRPSRRRPHSISRTHTKDWGFPSPRDSEKEKKKKLWANNRKKEQRGKKPLCTKDVARNPDFKPL